MFVLATIIIIVIITILSRLPSDREEQEETCEYYLNIMFNARSVLIGIKASSLFAVVFTMTRYIPLERPLFHAQQFYQNNNFIITFISVSLISFVLWFLILGLSIFGFRWYYEEARLSKYAPMGLCLAILSYCIFCQSAPRWYDGWDATHGSWHFPVPYEKIFIGNVMILLVGSIILKGIKKPVFYSLLFVYSIILSSFYFIFNISNNLFSGEELFLIYELINYTTNSNLLGFLIWYIVFALAFWIYIKEIFPEDFSSASSDINTKNA